MTAPIWFFFGEKDLLLLLMWRWTVRSPTAEWCFAQIKEVNTYPHSFDCVCRPYKASVSLSLTRLSWLSPHDLTCSNQNSPLHCGWLVLASRDDASELSCVKTLPKKIMNSEKGVTTIIRLWRWKSIKIPTACFSTVTRKKPAYIQMSKLSCSVLDVFVGMLVPQKRLKLKTPFFIIVTLSLSKHLTFI